MIATSWWWVGFGDVVESGLGMESGEKWAWCGCVRMKECGTWLDDDDVEVNLVLEFPDL